MSSSSSSSSSSFSSSSSSSSSSSLSSSSSSSSSGAAAVYTRTQTDALPADDTNLPTNFTAQDYIDVATDDEVYVVQDTVYPDYAIFLFKGRNAEGPAPVTISWNGKAFIAPSSYPVSLEVYNQITTSWENLQTNSTADSDTEFDLSGIIGTSWEDYYDGDNYISCRVYQPTV